MNIGDPLSLMTFVESNIVSPDIEKIAAEALEAETNQNWCQAAILWERIGDTESAKSCEEIAVWLAENNLVKFNGKKKIPAQTPRP